MGVNHPTESPHHLREAVPGLKKPGFVMESGGFKLDELCEQGVITDELLKKAGFIIIDEYPKVDSEIGEAVIATQQEQVFHRDSIIGMLSSPLLSLRFPDQRIERSAWTAIADREESAKKTLEYMLSLKDGVFFEEYKDLLAALKTYIDENGVESVLDSIFPAENGLFEVHTPLRELLSLNKFTKGVEQRYPQLREGLNKVVLEGAAKVEWRPGRVLVIDNVDAVHARIPNPDKTPQKTILLQRYLRFNADGTLKVIPQKTV